jgi:hypothetical protein
LAECARLNRTLSICRDHGQISCRRRFVLIETDTNGTVHRVRDQLAQGFWAGYIVRLTS